MDETIPLRTGIVPKFNKVFLTEIEVDDAGSAQQTKSQRDAGNFHILAKVWFDEYSDDGLPGSWRLVTNDPKADYQDPPVFTLLPPERSSFRSAANLTDYLRNERKKGDKPWLTPEYIAEVLYPLLRDGSLRDQNDLSDHINEVTNRPILKAKEIAEHKSKEAQHQRDEAERAKAIAEHEKLLAVNAKSVAEEEKRIEKEKATKAHNVALEASYVVDKLEEENSTLSLKLRATEEELANERLKMKTEQDEANKNKDQVTLSHIDTLIEVREQQFFRGSNCTILMLSDGSQRHMKIATFDPAGKVTKKAISLVGRRVRTSCWDPVQEPGKWSRQGYFRNIYLAE
jgi:hypothetical protein